MALRTKWSYAEQVLNGLQAQYQGRDLKIDPREVLLKLDSLVNEAAKANHLENWKRGMDGAIGDQWIVSFEWLTVTDASDHSYVALPSHYVSLEDNLGIDQVYFKNDQATKYYNPVIITSWKDQSTYKNTAGGYLEERISCFPRKGTLYFSIGTINATYGQIGLRLMVADSGQLADSDPYPIPANYENKIITDCIQFYREQLAQPLDLIKDADGVTTRR